MTKPKSERRPCAAMVSSLSRLVPCGGRGTIAEQGKMWCRLHAPSIVQARENRRDAVSDAKWQLICAAGDRAKCERGLVDLVIAEGCTVTHPDVLRQRSAVIAARAAEEAQRAELKALQEAPMK